MPAAPLSIEAASFAAEGTDAYEVQAGSMTGMYGRLVSYEVYRPAKRRSDAMAILGHGFGRDLTHMRGWARLWASRGLPTAVLSLPNSGPFAGNHDRNAADMKAAAALLHKGPVIYAGFSAGGLASLVAASSDPRTIGWLGLDPVDSAGLAAPAARALPVPALFLLGEPSSCNAGNNMLPVIPARPHVGAARVLHTVHCLFEDPTDSACFAVCGSVEPAEASREIATTIRAIATAWVLDRAGIIGEGDHLLSGLWTGSPEWAGRVQILQTPGT
jgi:pimeloyl-ACP methyl ester carboxylesterase